MLKIQTFDRKSQLLIIRFLDLGFKDWFRLGTRLVHVLPWSLQWRIRCWNIHEVSMDGRDKMIWKKLCLKYVLHTRFFKYIVLMSIHWNTLLTLICTALQSLFADGICPDTTEVLTKLGGEVGLDAEEVRSIVSNEDNVKKVRQKAAEWSQYGVSGRISHLFKVYFSHSQLWYDSY